MAVSLWSCGLGFVIERSTSWMDNQMSKDGSPIEIVGPSELGTFLSSELGLSDARWTPKSVGPQLQQYARPISKGKPSTRLVEFHIANDGGASGLRLDCPWDHLPS